MVFHSHTGLQQVKLSLRYNSLVLLDYNFFPMFLIFHESCEHRGREALTASTHDTFGKLLANTLTKKSLIDEQ
jgi:hypothetical protein